MIVENNDSENNTASHHPHDEVKVGPNLEYEWLIHTNYNFIIILEEKRTANVTCIPHICPIRYSSKSFIPVKVHLKVRKFATK